LRAEIEKRQNDVERAFAEKDEIKDKALIAKEALMRLESQAREKESLADRLEKETVKLSAEVIELKQQLMQKDSDLRSTLASMQENQRQAMDEKLTLRNQLRSEILLLIH
jgi:hypothetical protein